MCRDSILCRLAGRRQFSTRPAHTALRPCNCTRGQTSGAALSRWGRRRTDWCCPVRHSPSPRTSLGPRSASTSRCQPADSGRSISFSIGRLKTYKPYVNNSNSIKDCSSSSKMLNHKSSLHKAEWNGIRQRPVLGSYCILINDPFCKK